MRRLWCLLPAVALLTAACAPAQPTITPEQAKAFASVNAAANQGLLGPSVTPSQPAAKILEVVGDSYSVVTGMGGAKSWPALLSTKLGWSLHLDATAKTGYVEGGVGAVPDPFTSRLNAVVAAKPTAIIVFGSRFDVTTPQVQIQAAATTFLNALKQRLPTTPVVVIGPLWPVEFTPPATAAQLTGDIAGVKAAALAAGDPFIDPVGERWFAPSNATLVSSNHVDLTTAGQAYLAQRVAADLATVAPDIFPAAS